MDNGTAIDELQNFAEYYSDAKCHKKQRESLNHAIEILRKVDECRLVEVVRCGDCVYRNEKGYCTEDGRGGLWDTDFCSWGRKEE